MPKPNKGKTKTIKKRAIYVYLPSETMAQNWKNKADQAGTSISKFVIDKVEDSIRQEQGEEGYLNRLELINKLNKQEEELKQEFTSQLADLLNYTLSYSHFTKLKTIFASSRFNNFSRIFVLDN